MKKRDYAILVTGFAAFSIFASLKTRSPLPAFLMVIPAAMLQTKIKIPRCFSQATQEASIQEDETPAPTVNDCLPRAVSLPAPWGVGAPMFTLDRDPAKHKPKVGRALYIRPGLRALELPTVIDEENQGEMSIRLKPFSTAVLDSTDSRVFTPNSEQTDFDWPSMGGSRLMPRKKMRKISH